MAIQMRRGAFDDLDVSKLKPGEYAVCTNGYIVLKINGSQVVQIATQESLEQVVNTCEGYAEDCQEYMENANYTYFGFSHYPDGHDMTTVPDSSTRYIGIYNGHSETRPLTPSSYMWISFNIDIDDEDITFTIDMVDGHLYMSTDEFQFGLSSNGHLVIYSS